MVISREPKTCFKLKSGSSKKPVLIIGRWGIKENKRSREGCFRDFYTIYNSFFPLENNELVKLIFNSEPPHTLTWTDFQAFEFSHFFPLFALLQSSIERSIIISASQFTNFLSLRYCNLDSKSWAAIGKRIPIHWNSPFHEVAFSRLAPLNRETAGRRRIEGGEGAEGWIRERLPPLEARFEALGKGWRGLTNGRRV